MKGERYSAKYLWFMSLCRHGVLIVLGPLFLTGLNQRWRRGRWTGGRWCEVIEGGGGEMGGDRMKVGESSFVSMTLEI